MNYYLPFEWIDASTTTESTSTSTTTTIITSTSSATLCSASEFKCENFDDCIDASLVCDGIGHCVDLSDEANCDGILSTSMLNL